MREKRVVAFGAGYFAPYHFDAWSRLPGARLEAVCVRSDIERARRLAAEHGIARVYMDPERMLDEVEPDIADIIAPPAAHLPLVRLCAARRLSMICQKPLAPDFAEAEEIVRTAEAASVPLIVHENWRFKPWFREARRLIASGALGRLYTLNFRMRPGDGRGEQAYMVRQPYFRDMPRFLIHETGIHMVDVFRFLAGEVLAVSARLRRLNPGIAGEDAGLVVVEFASGAAGLLDGNRLSDFPAHNTRLTMGELLVEGEGGALRLDGEGRLFLRPHGGVEREHAYAWQNRGYGGDSVYALQAHALAHIAEGGPVENAGRAYLANLRIEEAIYRSHAECRRIELTPSDGA
jgi:predicted dehydrogenase